MTSTWDSYYVVFLSAVISLVIPASMAVFSLVCFKKKKKPPAKLFNQEGFDMNRTILGRQINIRFFLAANAALILITLALEIIPCATTLQSENHEVLIKGLISIVTLAGFAVLGLLYSLKKGDMGWLRSFQTDHRREVGGD